MPDLQQMSRDARARLTEAYRAPSRRETLVRQALRALTRAPMAVIEVLPVADTTAREHACALAALLAEMAIASAAVAPNANFLIMSVLPR